MSSVVDDRPAGSLAGRFVAGTYPESPAHILAGETMDALCGSRISPYKHVFATPPRRICAKCIRKQNGK